jgi:hypothetical protein
LDFLWDSVTLSETVFQAARRISSDAVEMARARSLRPLVKARAFGMTQQREFQTEPLPLSHPVVIPSKARNPILLSFGTGGFLFPIERADFCTKMWSILRAVAIHCGETVFMASNAVQSVADQVPADDFQMLEEKVYRTIEMYKAARRAEATAQHDAQRLRQQLQDREEELDALRRETVQLKKEREEIRARVEKMLEQIDSIAEAS